MSWPRIRTLKVRASRDRLGMCCHRLCGAIGSPALSSQSKREDLLLFRLQTMTIRKIILIGCSGGIFTPGLLGRPEEVRDLSYFLFKMPPEMLSHWRTSAGAGVRGDGHYFSRSPWSLWRWPRS